MIKKVIFLDSIRSKTAHELTKESFDNLLDSEKTKQIVAKIEAEPDPEKKKLLKGQLPVVMFGCLMTEDGRRPKLEDSPRPSGLCIHDWDHLQGDPRGIYFGQIFGWEKEDGIILVHVTPTGHGLRLVTTMRHGETIPECQERIASKYGMTKSADRSVKDITRLSFLPSRRYMLYVDEKALFESEMEEEKDEPAEAVSDEPAETVSMTDESDVQPQQTGTPTDNYAERYLYNGIRFSEIIDKLLERHASDGKVKEGERNMVLYHMAREIRHLCGYRFLDTYQLLKPYFSQLNDGEVRKTINSAINSNGKKMTDTVRAIVEEVRCESLGQDPSTEEGPSLDTLPKVSPIEEMILSHFPKHLRNQVYLASLPIWGTIGTHIRFDYIDNMENSLSFITAVYGKSGSGKSFARSVFNMMTLRLRERDTVERKKVQDYIDEVNRLPSNVKKPERPRVKVRLVPDEITISQLLEYIDALDGEHVLQFAEEVARLTKAKRSFYGDLDDILCKAFDNSVGGKESKSLLTKNIMCQIFLNALYCGTPGAMHKQFNNPEGGLNTRVIFAYVPDDYRNGVVKYMPFTVQEQEDFDEVCKKLDEAGRDGRKTRIKFLEKFIQDMVNEWIEANSESPNTVWFNLGKRALVMGFRAGVLEWYLNGCTDTPAIRKRVKDVVKWVAETVRASAYYFCGDEYEKIERADSECMASKHRMTKNKKLFSLLGDSFTADDVRKIRAEYGDSTNVNMIISRWVANGMIMKESRNCFRKCNGEKI